MEEKINKLRDMYSKYTVKELLEFSDKIKLRVPKSGIVKKELIERIIEKLIQRYQLKQKFESEKIETNDEKYSNNNHNVEPSNNDSLFFIDDDDELDSIKNDNIIFSKENIVNTVKIPLDIEKSDISVITYEDFKNIVKKDEFLNNFIYSLQQLYIYKIDKYTNLINTLNNQKLNDKFIEITDAYRTKPLLIQDMKITFESIINDKENGMETLIDRKTAKDTISRILYTFSKNDKYLRNKFLNFSIYGSPGSGKTKLGSVISYVFSKCGILGIDKLTIKTPNNLSEDDFIDNLESVLFIDEAYQFSNNCTGDISNPKFSATTSRNNELVDLINFMDKFIGLEVMIFAGYEKEMKNCFLKLNQGLARRIPNIILLESYTSKELMEIFKNEILKYENEKFIISAEEYNYIYSFIDEYKNTFEYFGSDIIEFVSIIMETVLSSINIEWINNDFKNNKRLLDYTFHQFLIKKNVYEYKN